MEQEKYMRAALELAREAFDAGEVPVGCVVFTRSGEIIGRGRNRREEASDATAHAEVEAIRDACAALGTWNLSGCGIAVTLEPCPMCAGAIINSRLSPVIYGAKEPNSGSVGSVLNLFEERYGHSPAVYGGVLADECAQLLADFFSGLRQTPSKN